MAFFDSKLLLKDNFCIYSKIYFLQIFIFGYTKSISLIYNLHSPLIVGEGLGVRFLKIITMYICSECGNEFLKWKGQCDFCKEWNTLKEFTQPKSSKKNTVPSSTEILSL